MKRQSTVDVEKKNAYRLNIELPYIQTLSTRAHHLPRKTIRLKTLFRKIKWPVNNVFKMEINFLQHAGQGSIKYIMK